MEVGGGYREILSCTFVKFYHIRFLTFNRERCYILTARWPVAGSSRMHVNCYLLVSFLRSSLRICISMSSIMSSTANSTDRGGSGLQNR